MDVVSGPCESLASIQRQINKFAFVLGMHIFSPNYSPNNKEFYKFLVPYLIFVLALFYSLGPVTNDFEGTAFWCVTFGFLLQVRHGDSCVIVIIKNTLLFPVSGQTARVSGQIE